MILLSFGPTASTDDGNLFKICHGNDISKNNVLGLGSWKAGQQSSEDTAYAALRELDEGTDNCGNCKIVRAVFDVIPILRLEALASDLYTRHRRTLRRRTLVARTL
jgi:hypothetical protein